VNGYPAAALFQRAIGTLFSRRAHLTFLWHAIAIWTFDYLL